MARIEKISRCQIIQRLSTKNVTPREYLNGTIIVDIRKGLIIQDKPDLYCELLDVGVEVTDASDPEDQEAHHLWCKLPYVNEKKKDSYLKRINQLGYECEWGALSPKPSKNCAVYDRGPASGPFMPVYSAIENKVVTLAKGQYQKCSKYELFIFRNVYFETVWLPFLLKNCRKKTSMIAFQEF